MSTLTVSPAIRIKSGQPLPLSRVGELGRVFAISIERNAKGSPIALEVKPDLPNDTTVFYPKREGLRVLNPRPGLPHEVAWTVSGLGEGETLEISPKSDMLDLFDAQLFTLTGSEQMVTSGPVNLSAPQGPIPRAYPWKYNVTLKGPGFELVLDPTIIVDEDP